MWNLLTQSIGEWGPIALDFLDGYGTADPRHYQKWGFPHYVLTDTEKSKELRSLVEYDHSGLIADGVVGQTMHALGTAWSYFPHSWGVRSGNKRTPIEVFNDDLLLRKAIVKMIRHTSNSRLTESVVRKGLRSFSGTQAVSNFRPTAAAAIYHHLLPEQGGVTWDMSSGWGGRLLGAIACPRVLKYIGTDPSTETINGLRKMAGELLPMAQQMGRKLEVELHQLGSEVYVPEPNSLDLCFTSPPYFDTEKYSDEPTQSYIQFPNADAWLTEFMGQTLRNCHIGLKPDGILAINIADVAGHPDLSRKFVEFAENNGWRLVETLHLSLSKMIGAKHKYNGTHKYEPIFVFKKK